MATVEIDQNQQDLLNIYDKKILPVGITAAGKTNEIVDIVSDYPWTAQQFDQRNTESNKMTYTHNIPFCYAIERQQTIGAGAANIVNSLLGSTQALGGATAIALREGAALVSRYYTQGQAAEKANKEAEENAAKQRQQRQTQEAGTPATPAATNTSNELPQNNAGDQSSSSALSFKNMLAYTDSLISVLRGLGSDFSQKVSPRLLESHLAGSPFLEPWKWLYLTKATTKKYVFPCFTANDLLKATNSYGGGGAMGGKIGGMFDSIIQWIQKFGEFAKGVKDFLDFFPQEGQSFSYENFEIEKALGYNYSGNGGQDFTSSFVLFNTTKKDAWKKNYRFLIMFLLRNIPFRTSIYSYKTPLLYDIIIPGIKHLPLCYVQNINISAQGHVRNMRGDNILREIVDTAVSSETIIPVPEAWRVDITFKCLIPDTSNLMLNLTSFPINITTADSSNVYNSTSTNIIAVEESVRYKDYNTTA